MCLAELLLPATAVMIHIGPGDRALDGELIRADAYDRAVLLMQFRRAADP